MTLYPTTSNTNYPRFHARLAASRKIRPDQDKMLAQVLSALGDIKRALRWR